MAPDGYQISTFEQAMNVGDDPGGINMLFTTQSPQPSGINDGAKESEAYIDDLCTIYPLPGIKENIKRTRKKAALKNRLSTIPENAILLTLNKYDDSMQTGEKNGSYMQPINPEFAKCLIINGHDARLYYHQGNQEYLDVENSGMDLDKYYDMSIAAAAKLDLMLLRALYSVILLELQKELTTLEAMQTALNDPQYIIHSIRIYIPELMKKLGYATARSKATETAILSKIRAFSNVLGVTKTKNSEDLTYKRYTLVMIIMDEDEASNTVLLSSPYINQLIMRVMLASVKKDRNKRPMLKKNGAPQMHPAYSSLVRMSIGNEKNKRAIEIVCEIVKLIEQCGSGHGTPNIKIITLIQKCPDLKIVIDNPDVSTANKNNTLRRTFKKVWELLETKTRLKEAYNDIQFPTLIPTMTKLDTVVKFPHNGKINREEENELQ